ncbi:unnamed protein product [Arabidopsis thaliana]|uniref:(thale cress) hypothetical protein n=1 Tax=Arabidopsis thaliana TaxID=3702 RepID=A0A7G2EQK3_ARATH|nr:unnamed protein product [Arabidopsis thaliana]
MLSCSNGTVVIATAMVCSSTALFLAMARQFHGNHQNPKVLDQTLRPILRSCLSSEETKKQGKKIKKVRFADNVKDTKESLPCQRTGWLCTMGFLETEITEFNILIDFFFLISQ